jgi:uncharacterized repeat protein (TIGR01451 family)
VDGGASWLPVFELTSGVRDLRPLEIASTAALPTRLFAGYLATEVTPTFPIKTALLRSIDSGVTWQEVFVTSGGTDIRINVDPLSPDTVYAVITKDAGPEIVRSIDGGASWAPLLVNVPGVRELLPDPNEAGTIWAAGDRVYVSKNSGSSWTMFEDTGLPSSGVGIRALEISGSSTPMLHAGTTTGVFSTPLAIAVDLAVTKEDGVGEVLPGGDLLYAVMVENLGPSDVVGARVTDTLPAALTCDWTCTGSGGGVCSPGPVTGDINTAVDLPAGAGVVFSVDCNLDGGASGLVSNTATVAVPVGVVDLAAANNSATDADVVLSIGACGAYEDRALRNLTFDTVQTIEACNSISAGESVLIVQPADVIFRAGSLVVLDNGFSVGENALFAVDLDQPMP